MPSLQIRGTHLKHRFTKSDDDLIKIAADMTHIEDSASLQSDTCHYEIKLKATSIDTCPNPKFLSAPFPIRAPKNL